MIDAPNCILPTATEGAVFTCPKCWTRWTATGEESKPWVWMTPTSIREVLEVAEENGWVVNLTPASVSGVVSHLSDTLVHLTGDDDRAVVDLTAVTAVTTGDL